MKIRVRKFFDAHCHFRDPPVYVKYSLPYCSYAIAMPNTTRRILCAKDVVWYLSKINQQIKASKIKTSAKPLMTIKITDKTNPKTIEGAKMVNAVAGKVYPAGIYQGEGLSDFFSDSSLAVFSAMQDAGMLLLLHGELNPERTLFTKREKAFLPILKDLAEKFPKLKIVLEHVSTQDGIKMVESLGSNIAATITAHHPLLTLNDARLNPHNTCNPTPNDFDDRDALLKAITSGNPKFFLGSDTAPHIREKKECSHIACGVFSAPVLPQILCETFKTMGCLDKLQDFTSTFGCRFYGLPVVDEYITLDEKEWTVPEEVDGAVPFMAGQKLKYQLI